MPIRVWCVYYILYSRKRFTSFSSALAKNPIWQNTRRGLSGCDHTHHRGFSHLPKIHTGQMEVGLSPTSSGASHHNVCLGWRGSLSSMPCLIRTIRQEHLFHQVEKEGFEPSTHASYARMITGFHHFSNSSGICICSKRCRLYESPETLFLHSRIVIILIILYQTPNDGQDITLPNYQYHLFL